MKHFTSEDLVRDLKSELLGLTPNAKLKPDCVPHLNLVKSESSEVSQKNLKPQVTRSGRIVKRKLKSSPKIEGMY